MHNPAIALQNNEALHLLQGLPQGMTCIHFNLSKLIASYELLNPELGLKPATLRLRDKLLTPEPKMSTVTFCSLFCSINSKKNKRTNLPLKCTLKDPIKCFCALLQETHRAEEGRCVLQSSCSWAATVSQRWHQRGSPDRLESIWMRYGVWFLWIPFGSLLDVFSPFFHFPFHDLLKGIKANSATIIS